MPSHHTYQKNPQDPAAAGGGGIPDWLGPVITAGAEIGSTIIGNRNRSGEARKAEDFSEQMRNTSWQAAVEDMEKAGLNPALAYSQGGATSPSGMMSQQSDVLGTGISSAQQARRLQKELKLLTTQEIKTYEDARLSRAATTEASRRSELITRQQTGVDLNNALRQHQLFSAKNAAAVEKTPFGMKAHFADRIRSLLFGGGGALGRINISSVGSKR